MKQPKLMSFIESIINILVGFGISCAAQAVFLPMLGVPIPWDVNLAFAGIMTVISIARSFVLRRLFEALHIRRPLSPFMLAVVAERYRQIDVEGWTLEHDDGHEVGELACAGAAYVQAATITEELQSDPEDEPPSDWPWSRSWWKPVGFRRDMVKGCALIIAEGEKHDRNRKQRTRAPAAIAMAAQ